MDFNSFNLYRSNITLVFEKLNRSNFSLDEITSFFGDEVNIHQVNPDIFVLIFNDGIQCQLGQRRMSLNFELTEADIESKTNFIIDRLIKLIDLLKEIDLEVFGFNYDGDGSIKNEKLVSGLYFKEKFFANEGEIFSNANGELTSFSPNFRISLENKDYNIKLTPQEENKFNFHFNVHFNKSVLPDKQKLQEIFIKEYYKSIDLIKNI